MNTTGLEATLVIVAIIGLVLILAATLLWLLVAIIKSILRARKGLQPPLADR
jgi:hypothetical protein